MHVKFLIQCLLLNKFLIEVNIPASASSKKINGQTKTFPS